MNAVELLLTVYGVTGLVFAIAFVTAGAARIDAAAKRSSWGFRIIILPASVALWPWLFGKWVRT